MVHARRVIVNAIVYVNRPGAPGGTCPTNSRPGAPSTATPHAAVEPVPLLHPCPAGLGWCRIRRQARHLDDFSWRSSASATHTPSRCCPAAGSSSAP